jgi:hypothetical protein
VSPTVPPTGGWAAADGTGRAGPPPADGSAATAAEPAPSAQGGGIASSASPRVEGRLAGGGGIALPPPRDVEGGSAGDDGAQGPRDAAPDPRANAARNAVVPGRAVRGVAAEPVVRGWVIAGPAVPARWGRRVGWVWAAAAVGTAAAALVDRLAGGLDGRPAFFLLVVLALPFWDRLPTRVTARLAELAAVVAGLAAVWLALAALRPEGWWRSEVAYGLACGIAGTAHALATRRRTVER